MRKGLTVESMSTGLFVPARATGAGLLFVHGLGSDQVGYRARAEVVAPALGTVCLTFDLRGHGESPGELGKLTPRDHLADVVAAYDALAGNPAVDPARIGVCAASYGAYLAALLTAERPVRRLLLRAPGLYCDEQLDRPLAGGRRSSVQVIAWPPGAAEVLIVACGADDRIPPAVIEAYREAWPQARVVVWPGAPHHLATDELRQAFLDAILEFFAGL